MRIKESVLRKIIKESIEKVFESEEELFDDSSVWGGIDDYGENVPSWRDEMDKVDKAYEPDEPCELADKNKSIGDKYDDENPGWKSMSYLKHLWPNEGLVYSSKKGDERIWDRNKYSDLGHRAQYNLDYKIQEAVNRTVKKALRRNKK